MGPTASGKTALGVALAQALNGEIVSVDSALVYRGMDIGTAKPTAAEQGGIRHHLMDLCDPAEAYSAQQFVDDAQHAIRHIHQAGKLPILVGGTMLYFRSLLAPMATLPAADQALRDRLAEEYRVLGAQALHLRLQTLDPVAAEGIHPNNRQRLLRALEVCTLTGQPMSEVWQQHSLQPLPGQVSHPEWGRVLQIGLFPEQRLVLHERIRHRFDAMLEAGFLAEVLALQGRPDLSAECPAMRTVGYRQLWQYAAGELSWEEAQAAALAATRQLAKRQLTWLRRWQNLQCFDMIDPDLSMKSLDWIAQHLDR
jgi:tRNA dimethylallyltransferase